MDVIREEGTLFVGLDAEDVMTVELEEPVPLLVAAQMFLEAARRLTEEHERHNIG